MIIINKIKHNQSVSTEPASRLETFILPEPPDSEPPAPPC